MGLNKVYQHLDLGLGGVHIDGKIILFVNYLLFALFHAHLYTLPIRFRMINTIKSIMFVHF